MGRTRVTGARRWRWVVVALAMALVAAACGDDDDSGGAAGAETEAAGAAGGGGSPDGSGECEDTTTILNPTISATYQQAHVYVADALDLWSQYCLEIDYRDITSSQITSVYIAGEVQYGQLGAGPVGPLLAQGVPVSVDLVHVLRYGYVFLVADDIESWEDLRGQPIAITGELGTPHRSIIELMESEGEDPDEHTFVSLNDFTNIVAAAQSGQVKAVAAGLPHSNQLREMGFHEIANIAEMEDLLNPAGIVGGDPDWIAENPEAATAFVKAWLEGVWAMFTDPELAKEAMAERLGMTDPDEIDQAYQAASYVIRFPQEQCDNEDYYELFKTNYPNPDEIDDPTEVAPETDICGQLEEEGFFEQLEEEYGPLPERPETSGL